MLNLRYRQILCLILLISTPLHAASIKKWVDENGVTHYGTTIPPEYIQREHQELNSSGIPTMTRGAAKTKEEIARERELERLKQEKQRLVAEQQSRDKILLNMYRTEDDLIMLRDGKLAQIDAQIRLKESQLKRQKRRLEQQQQHAAQLEREGKPIGPQLQHNLEASQKHIENSYSSIVSKQQEKERIRQQYNRDLKRLRELRRKTSSRVATQEEPADTQPRELPGVFYCGNHCDGAWQKAKAYARKFSTTEISMIGETIWLSKPALGKTDISISLARIASDQQEKIFLDLKCAESPSGRALCEQAHIRSIVNDFAKHLSE